MKDSAGTGVYVMKEHKIELEVQGIFREVPKPRRPVSFGEDYAFPEDSTLISNEELGTLMLKLAAWQGYAMREVALVDVQKSLAKYKYERALQHEIVSIPDARRQTRELLVGYVLENQKDVAALYERAKAEEVKVNVWQKIISIYEVQSQILSRELSRRLVEIGSLGRTERAGGG